MASSHQQLLSMLYNEANITESPVVFFVTSEGSSSSLPEPVPEWSSAQAAYSWGWYVHTYGFGAGFFMLALYSLVAVFEFRRRLKVQRYLLGINGMLFMLGLSRALYLFVDPYHSTFRLPPALSQVLYGITFPCLTSSFSLIQMVFMRITKVRMGPNKLQNYRVLAAIITSHFTIVIVIDVTVAYRNNLKLLLLLCQSIFITWGLVLCFGFVYGGFKMTQFTNETQRVLRQLVAYNRVKQETLRNGNYRQLALHRISKPKIRITDEENKTLSYGSESSPVDTSDTMSFYNEAHLEFGDEETLAKAYRLSGKIDRGYRLRESVELDKQKEYEVSSHLNKRESQVDFTSESDYVTDTPSTAGPGGADDRGTGSSEAKTNGNVYHEAISNSSVYLEAGVNHSSVYHDTQVYHDGSTFDEVDLMSQSVCSSTAAMLIEEAESPPHFVNPALDDLHHRTHVKQHKDGSTSIGGITSASMITRDGEVIGNGYALNNIEFLRHNANSAMSQQDMTTTVDGLESISLEEIPQESGYMADTELNSPVQKKKRVKGRHTRGVSEPDDPDDGGCTGDTEGGSPVHQPYPLKSADGTVSLYRIRQGRVLHKTLRITYITTLFGFISCILHLYAMFGVYGVLSREKHADTWPWFIFHTFYRLTEVMMAGSMAATTFYFGKQRHRAATRRKHQDLTNQTKC